MEINSIPIVNSPKGREKLKTVGAPAVLAAGATFVATKMPKGSNDTISLTKRLSKAGKAGLFTAAAMAIITTNKEEIKGVIDKVKNFIGKKDSKASATETEDSLAKSADTALKDTAFKNAAEEAESLKEDKVAQNIENEAEETSDVYTDESSISMEPIKETPLTPNIQGDAFAAFRAMAQG